MRSLPSVALLAALTALGCATTPAPPRQPPGRPPTPQSVTRSQPGGDADDPHRAALERLIAEPWGAKNDRDDQVVHPLPDFGNWRRVRYWGFEHLTGFRYGKEHHGVGAAVVIDLPAGTPVRSETCLGAFEAWARPQVDGLDVKFDAPKTRLLRWRDQPLVVQSMDGFLSFGLASTEFSAAYAAYPAYQGACLVYAVAFPWREQKELAQKARDRFASEGFQNLQALTEVKAFRHPRPDPPPHPANAERGPVFQGLFRKFSKRER